MALHMVFFETLAKMHHSRGRLAILINIHKGLYGSHESAQTITKKALRQGSFWPSAIDDVKEILQKYRKCQEHNFIPKSLVDKLSTIGSP